MRLKCNFKKGMALNEIVVLILIIASFLVILFFIVKLNLGGIGKDEVCRNSVILAGKNSASRNLLPTLNCRSEKVCISKGDKCDSFSYDKKIDLKSFDSDDLQKELFTVLAEEMADCWFMFGEGKIEYLGISKGAFSTACGICDKIKFSPQLIIDLGDKSSVSISDFSKFLSNNILEKKNINYNLYLYSENDFCELDSLFKCSQPSNNLFFSASKIYLIVTGINPESGTSIFIPPFFLDGEEINSRMPGVCKNFDLTTS